MTRSASARLHRTIAILTLLLLAACGGQAATPPAATPRPTVPPAPTATAVTSGSVNLYTSYPAATLAPVLARFTAATSIAVNVTTAPPAALVANLLPAEDEPIGVPTYDAVLSSDAGGLERLAQAGVLQRISSDTLDAALPATVRDTDDRWYGLALTLYPIAYSRARLAADEAPTSYATLAGEQWQGRLCLPPADAASTVSLVAGILATYGAPETERMVQGWATNAAAYPADDAATLAAIAAGDCDVALVAHSALGNADDAAIAVQWADQPNPGVQRNATALGVLAAAPNQAQAVRLLKWLATDGQGTTPATLPGSIGALPAAASLPGVTLDRAPLKSYGTSHAAAVQLLESVGYGEPATAATR